MNKAFKEDAGSLLQVEFVDLLKQGEIIGFQHGHKEWLAGHEDRGDPGCVRQPSQKSKIKRSIEQVSGELNCHLAYDFHLQGREYGNLNERTFVMRYGSV